MKIIIGAIVVLILMIGAQSAFAQIGAPLSKHPISDMLSGYDHGVSDANKPEYRDLYIWVSPHGFINQTKEFIQGYILGYCSIRPNTGMDEDEAAFYGSDGPSSADWAIGYTIRGTNFHRDPALN